MLIDSVNFNKNNDKLQDMDCREESDPSDLENPELALIKELCNRLSEVDIHYCHWKSNAALDLSTQGLNDLDLLVEEADSGLFLTLLNELGFKKSFSVLDSITPGIDNYYAYDTPSQVLVNVHAHFKLILGHDFTKNYHIPVEKEYIKSSRQENLFQVPAADFELIILVIRLVIKHFTWDSILLGHKKLSTSEKNELDFLLSQVSMSEVECTLATHFQFIEEKIFKDCLSLCLSDYRETAAMAVSRKLMKCLTPYASNSRSIDAVLKIWRRFYWPFYRLILRKDLRKKIRKGGLIIAITGGDGAGKTTVVNALYQWMNGEFAIKKFHMGKPKWSLLTILVRGFIKIGRTIGLYPFQRTEIQYSDNPDLLDFPGYPWLFREVCTARDRFITYKKAMWFANEGGIVILDRFPLSQIKFMDGPQIARMTTKIKPNFLIRYFRKIEENYYQKMATPDLVIVLRVNPEIAVQRKTDEIETNVRPRSKEIWDVDWTQTGAIVIDASLPKEVVLGQVKELVWSNL